MTARKKRRRRQKYRVLKAQEYLAGLHPLQFAALLTALDDLDDFDAATVLVPWGDEPPRLPTRWEIVKQFFIDIWEKIFGRKDAEDN